MERLALTPTTTSTAQCAPTSRSACASWLCALLLAAVLVGETCAERGADVALVTSATSYPELIAARTALHSARRNGQLGENASYVIFTSSNLAERVVEAVAAADAIVHYPLPLRRRLGARSRVLPLFALNFDKVIYVSPYSLIVSSLKPLLSCHFCATVTKPCAFSTNLLVLTPSADAHDDLLRLSHPSSNVSTICADDPDPEACILNRYIPLDDAPLFPQPADAAPRAMRFPPAMTTPHYLYYQRMRWELPSDHCGLQTIIDFTNPAFTRPTNIITLVLLRLNRQWYEYRSQLQHIATENVLSEALLVLTFLSVMVALYVSSVRLPGPAPKHRRSLSVISVVPHELLIFYWVSVSFIFNAVCWLLSVHICQPCSSLSIAIAVLLLSKIVCSSVAYGALGSVFMRFATPDDVELSTASMITTHRAAFNTVSLNMLEAIVVSALVYTSNVLPAETGFRRLVWLLVCIAIYFAFWLYVMIVLFWSWLAAGAWSVKVDKV